MAQVSKEASCEKHTLHLQITILNLEQYAKMGLSAGVATSLQYTDLRCSILPLLTAAIQKLWHRDNRLYSMG